METLSDNSKVIKGRGELTRLPEFENCDHIIVSPGFTSLGENCFKNFKAKRIDLCSTIREIKKNAFFNCQELKSIDIPKGVVTIGESAFSWCSKLRHIQLPYGLKKIGLYAFHGTQIQKLDVPNTVTEFNISYCLDDTVKELRIPAVFINKHYNTPIDDELKDMEGLEGFERLEELYIRMNSSKTKGMIEELKDLRKTLRIYLINDGYVFKMDDNNKEEYEINKSEIISIHNHAKLGNKCNGYAIKGNSILPSVKFILH